ncbi:hypothetical protein MMC06_005521 [Schaereria dolodes]|nr:hypothetical protein [Schaereria dolodes]
MSSIASRSSRARKPGIRKQPSVTSLFSNLTTSSSGSNSTITQESFNQSRQRASKQMVPKKGTTPKHGPKKPSARLSPSVSPIDERPNVFAFMEKDEDDESVMDGSDIGEVSYSGTSIQQPGMVNELAGRDASPTMSFSSSPQESQYSEDCHHLWNDDHAVSSYSNLTKSLNPTSQASVDAYKDWIVQNMPLIEQETEFLHHESDLGTIATQPSRTETPASEASLMAPGFTLLSTIITFKLVPYFIARLVVATTALGMVYAFSPATLLNSTMPGNYRRTFAM